MQHVGCVTPGTDTRSSRNLCPNAITIPALALTPSDNTWLGHAWKAVLSLPAGGKGVQKFRQLKKTAAEELKVGR